MAIDHSSKVFKRLKRNNIFPHLVAEDLAIGIEHTPIDRFKLHEWAGGQGSVNPRTSLNAVGNALETAGNKTSADVVREVAAATAAPPTTVVSTGKPEPVGEYNYEKATRKNTSNYFSFPIDIENKDGLPYVIFYVYDTVTTDIPGAVKDDRSGAALKTGVGQLFGAGSAAAEVLDTQVTGGLAGSAATAVIGTVDDLARAGINVGSSDGNLSTLLKERFKGFSLRRNIQRSNSAIVLFMPDSLQANYEHNYDEISLTATLGAAGMLAQAVADNAGGAAKATDPYILEAASRVIGNLPGLQSSEDLTNLLVFGTTGKAINPQMEVLYNSPRLRTFTFDFRLVPKSKEEAVAIKNIVNRFKFYSAPTIQAQTSGRYYTPPSRFVMEFHHRGSENPYLFKTKQCVLESISIDYAPNGYATHYDGSPVETRLQLIFKETTMISRDDLDPENPDFNGGATF